MTFGERLTELRKKRKLTQEQISKKLHTTRSTYAQYEVDRRVPEYATLQKLADFFNVSIDYLVGREEKQKKEETQEETQLEKDKKYALDLILGITDPDKQKAAIEYLKFLAGEK